MHQDTFRRWRDLFAYSMIGLAAVPFAIRLSAEVAESLTITTPGLPIGEISKYVFAALGLVSMSALLRPRLAHFQYALSFPPTVTAIPLAGIMACVIARIYSGISPSATAIRAIEMANDLAVAITLYCGILIIWLLARQRRGTPILAKVGASDGPKLQLSDLLDLEIEKVLQWASNEAPISSRTEDLFGMDLRADRIFESLRRNRPNQSGQMFPQTVVIQGPFGSGKSSLVQLVKSKATELGNPKMIFVELNCWGFESTIRAQEHVLTQCVEALHDHIDCSSIRTMPSRYAQALSESTPTWLGSLFDVFTANASPREQIAQFAPLLRITKTQLVAVVEDTDRNGENFDPSNIEAMLFHFRSVEHLSFILTTGPSSNIEFPKIAERIEFLPSLPKHVVLALLDRVRDHCRNQEFVDPVSTGGRSQNRFDSLLARSEAGKNYRIPTWAEAMGRLINHPRQLKQLLNSYCNAWGTLRGEVDFDELLMVTALRQAAPGAFTFLGVNIERLRALKSGNWSESERDKEELTKQIADLAKAWKDVISTSDFDIGAAEILLNELVPSSTTLFGPRIYAHGNRVQSIVYLDGPDYWNRITSESLNPYEIRDQKVLKAIASVDVLPESRMRLAKDIVISEAFARVLSFFEEHHALLGDRAPDVLSAILAQLRGKLGRAANDDALFYQSSRRSLAKKLLHNDEKLQPWLREEIGVCFPGHIRLACDLFSDFARRTSIAGDIRRFIHKEVEGHFSNAPGILFSRGFDPSFPWTLYHLLFAYGDDHSEENLSRGEDWQFLVPVVLDGLKQNADVMVPATLFAFGEERTGTNLPTSHIEFRENLLTEFFGDRKQEFFTLTANYTVPNTVPKQWAHRLQLSINAASIRAEKESNTRPKISKKS